MGRYEYVRIRIEDIPDEIIEEYGLHEKVADDGHVYIKICKGMYGLPQAGILAQELLEKRLNMHGYSQSAAVPGLWTHKTRPITFTLVVDDFGVKYVGKEHAMHLINILKRIMKYQKTGQGINISELPLIGIIPISECTSPCRGILKRRSSDSGMSARDGCNFHLIHMWRRHMAQRRSLLNRKCKVRHSSKRGKNMCRWLWERCCITAEL